MILEPNVPWHRLLFWVSGTSLQRTWRRILAITVFSIAVTVLELTRHLENYINLTTAPFQFLGVAIAIFLGFRNNAAYDRFWEGRKLWGALVNSSRSLARQSMILVAPGEHDVAGGNVSDELSSFRREMGKKISAFPHALRCHLRDIPPWDDLKRLLSDKDIAYLRDHSNVPLALLHLIGQRYAWAHTCGWIHDLHYIQFEQSLVQLTDIQGACERIKGTPFPFAYTVLLHQTVAFYCLALPFGLIKDVRWLTPVVTVLISHAFLGLDAIGDELEQPFGLEPNDLPLDDLCLKIESSVKQIVEEDDLPQFNTAKRGVIT